MTFHAALASPLGDILLCAEGEALSGLYFVGQSDCPRVPGLSQARRDTHRPSEGMLAGQQIRRFKAYRAESDDLFAPASAGQRLLPTEAGLANIADPHLLQGGTPDAVCALFRAVQAELGEYFAGRRTVFDVPLEPRGTDFQKKVWRALLGIPYGTVVSYGDVARAAGLTPQHGRPVGSAVGHNPVTIIIPCHRVVSGTRALTGYTGGLERKFELLQLEGFTLY